MIDPFKIKRRDYVLISSKPVTPYIELGLKQGTSEWINARYDYVTASDVAAILGIKDYKTREQVMNIKLTRREPVVNSFKQSIFEMGHLAEESARKWASQVLNIHFESMVLVSRAFPHLMASLDGFDVNRNLCLEAKYLGEEACKDVKAGKFKANHMAQIQAQLLVSGAKKAMYFAMDPKGNAEVVAIYPDPEMQHRIVTETKRFFTEWQERKKANEQHEL
jgi:putative phage-type endonuclease